MNEIVIILGGALCVAVAVALIVGGARSRVGTAGNRVGAILAGFLALAFGLMLMAFGLPRVSTPYLLPSSIVGAVVIGWIVGYAWGEMGKRSTR